MPSRFQPKPIPEPLWDGKEETRLTYWNKKQPPSLPYALGTPIFPLEKLKLIDFSNKRKALTPVDQMTLGELEAQDYEMINFLDGKMTNYKEIRERYSETPRYCSICTEHAGKHFHEENSWSLFVTTTRRRWPGEWNRSLTSLDSTCVSSARQKGPGMGCDKLSATWSVPRPRFSTTG